MGRKPQGDSPLTGAQREARRRRKRDAKIEGWRLMFEQIRDHSTDPQARVWAAEALAQEKSGTRAE